MRGEDEYGDTATGGSAVVAAAGSLPRQESAYVRPSIVLRAHREAVLELARAHRADGVKVFGSAARGDDVPGSDLDLLVTLPEDADIFDLAELNDDIERLTGLKVDIVSGRGLNARGEAILADAVVL